MIKNNISEEKMLKLKGFLDRINYHLMMTMILGEATYFTNPIPDYYTVKRELKKVDIKYQKLISFFMLGEPVERKILDLELDSDVIEHLYELEIINCDEEDYWLNNYILTSYCNCYFLVSNIYYYPTCQNQVQKPYIGLDSYWLSRIIVNQVSGNVLDLCTGSGIQAILSAKTADKVVGIDVDEQSIEIAKFNAYLNGVHKKVDFKLGNLYEPINEYVEFDYITSNPPFIPIPDSVEFPIAGDGGEDGKDIIRRIFWGYRKHLKLGGKGIMIGQAIGDSERVFISEDIRSILIGLDCTIYYSGKTPIENQASQFAELATNINKKEQIESGLWNEMYRKMGAEYLYNFTLIATRGNTSLKEIYIMDNWDKEDIPNINICNSTKISENYNIQIDKGPNFVVDDEALMFINLINGNSSVGSIIKNMPFKFKVKYGNEGEHKLLAKYLSLCASYERYGLINKVNSK